MQKFNWWRLLKITFALALAVGWGSAIFHLSAMDSTDSNDASTSIVDSAIRDLLIVTNNHQITNVHLTDEQIDYAAALINAPLRKVFHAAVYLILVILLIIVGNIIFGARRYWLICLFSFIFCIFFALTDEYHQTFVDGRTGQLLDVFIDSIGAFIGSIIATSYYLAWRLGQKSVASPKPTSGDMS